MSFWDSLTGRKSAQKNNASSQPSSTATATATLPAYTPPTSDDVSSFINTPGAFDPAALHPLAGLNQDTLEYLSLDDAVLEPSNSSILPSRGWSDDLCYGTGITYLSGLGLGGIWGLVEGMNRLPPTAPAKLRLNSVLNGVTRRGPFLGNSAGVVAMMYNGLHSFIGYQRGKQDTLSSITAGAISGMLFKSTRGLRPMLISGTIVGSVAGTWSLARKTFEK